MHLGSLAILGTTSLRCAHMDVFEFGGYRLDADRGLSRGDEPIPLAPKELAVLLALVQRRGKLASKLELLSEVWRDEPAGDESLTRCIYVLRRRLRNGADPIATVHRRGYRLTLPVRHWQPGPCNMLQRSVQTNTTAHIAYLEGRQRARLGTAQALLDASRYYEEAARLDPQYAVALTALADCRIHQCVRRLLAPLEAAAAIRHACERALAIDPLLASAHAALGWVEGAVEWRHHDAIASLDRALQLDPQYATGYLYRAWVLRGQGAHELAIADLHTACGIDPYVYLYRIMLVWTLFLAGRHQEALAAARTTASHYPSLSTGFAYWCAIAGFLGNHGEAHVAGERATELAAGDPTVLTARAYACAAAGSTAAAQKVLATILDHPAMAVRSLLPPVFIALGDNDMTEHWLAAAHAERCPWLLSTAHDPRLATHAESLRARLACAAPSRR